METKKFKVIIVEDVKLELKGTEEIFRHEIPSAEVIGTAMSEAELWLLLETHTPDMVLLDLGLGGSTTVGVEICRSLRVKRPEIKILIFTGEVLNEKLWVDVLEAGADGISGRSRCIRAGRHEAGEHPHRIADKPCEEVRDGIPCRADIVSECGEAIGDTPPP